MLLFESIILSAVITISVPGERWRNDGKHWYGQSENLKLMLLLWLFSIYTAYDHFDIIPVCVNCSAHYAQQILFGQKLKIPCTHSQRVIFCRDWRITPPRIIKWNFLLRENPTKSCNIILCHHDGGLKLKGNEIHSIVPLALVNITERETIM